MKNKILVLFFILLGLPAWAATQQYTFVLTATVPAATSVGVNVFKVDAASNKFVAMTGTDLNFNPMKLDPVNGIYLPDHYYALDITPQGGAAGNMSTTFQFNPGTTPNANGHGLGWKSTATFMKVTGSGTNTSETGLMAHGPKKMLKDVHGEQILGTETLGGWARVYLGIVTKNATGQFPDPPASEPFSNGDAPGSYDGTLVITTTVL